MATNPTWRCADLDLVEEAGPVITMRPLLLSFVLFGSALLNAQSSCDSLRTLLGTMIEEYDVLSVENEQIAAEVNLQRTQVDSLRAALNRGNYDLDKARKEAEVLRRIMTGYVVTIDSMNSANKALQRIIHEQNGQDK
jgi:hypothetical protein